MTVSASDDEIVRIAVATTTAEAYAWRQALQDEGVSCKVVGEYLTGLGMTPGGSMAPEIWVHRNDEDRAKSILKPWLEKTVR